MAGRYASSDIVWHCRGDTLKKVSARWRKLLALIPGYDCFASAAPGEWFDEKAADFAVGFFPTMLKHAKGPMYGEPFVLEPWQQAITGALWGWKRKDGTRRYRECLMYVAKKNGKTAWAAGMLLLILNCGELRGAELYSAAASGDQAAIIFSHMVGMVKQDEGLSKQLTLYGEKGGSVRRSIVYEDRMSSYRCLASDADTADGANVAAAVIDELHRHKTPDLAEILKKNTAAQAEPLIIDVTTADWNRPSLCNTMLGYAKQVRENNGDPNKPGYDSAFLPVIYEATADDDWKDPKVWAKANPNLGVSIPLDFFERECRKAQDVPSELNNFLRLHLNIVTDAEVALIPMDKWDACKVEIDEDALVGCRCFAGLDLASRVDVAAWVLMFPPESEGDAWVVLPRLFVPADNAHTREKRDRVPYSAWGRQGFVTLTPGNVIDYETIRCQIMADGKQFDIVDIGADPWNLEYLQQRVGVDGIKLVPFIPGFKSMTTPMKEFESMVLSGRIAHDGNPALRWMVGNLVASTNSAGDIKPDKKKSTEKIDGVVAMIMALGRALVAEEECHFTGLMMA